MRKGFTLTFLTVIGLVASANAAPGKRDKATVVGSCTIAEGISCSDYEGMPAKTPQEMCVKYRGKWSSKACPVARRVGTCTQPQGSGRILTHSYPPSTPDIARKACRNTPGGKFSAN
jgi:hypothetical protein